jgi:prepilin peptidase CpaA
LAPRAFPGLVYHRSRGTLDGLDAQEMIFGGGPSMEAAPYVCLFALLLAGTAAITDWRTGHIPNWLTLPPIALGPIVYGIAFGLQGFLGAILAVVVCGVVPLLMFRVKGMAGGDVKLFAALAAICGTGLALEAQVLALIIGSIYALGRLTWDGKLFRTLSNALFLTVNPVLPKRLQRTPNPELLAKLRLGGAIFAGLLLVCVGRWQGALFG